MNDFFDPYMVEHYDFFMNLKTFLGPEKYGCRGDMPSGSDPWNRWPGLTLDSGQMTRRAGVSRVIRVQRRYAVHIRPMGSTTWAHFGCIFELFIELYNICTHFSYIEYVLWIHFVKIS